MTEDEEEAKMLNAILDELKMNALVITDPYNMRHVSGFPVWRGRYIFNSPEGADHRFPLYGAGR